MTNLTTHSPDYLGAQHYALDRLERELPPSLLYHSLWHTRDEVAVRAIGLAQEEGLSPEMQKLISSAAYFHDIGFVLQPTNHEVISAQIATEILPHFGFLPTHIALVRGMILATQLPQTPHNRLEQIVADADLDVLGRDDFFSRNLALRAESARSGVTTSDAVWYTQQLQLMQIHRYFTKSAIRERSCTKQCNIQHLRRIIADCCPHAQETPVTLSNPSLAIF
jgi:uncharacterized protein